MLHIIHQNSVGETYALEIPYICSWLWKDFERHLCTKAFIPFINGKMLMLVFSVHLLQSMMHWSIQMAVKYAFVYATRNDMNKNRTSSFFKWAVLLFNKVFYDKEFQRMLWSRYIFKTASNLQLFDCLWRFSDSCFKIYSSGSYTLQSCSCFLSCFTSSFFFEFSDICQRQSIPAIHPAEHFSVKICE